MICFVLGAQNNDLLYRNNSKNLTVGPKIKIYEDKTNKLSIEDVKKIKTFKNYNKSIPSFGLSNSTFWAKFNFINKSDYDDFILEFDKVDFVELKLFSLINNETYIEHVNIKNNRTYSKKTSSFRLNIKKNITKTIYIKFKTNWSVTIPVKISNIEYYNKNKLDQELINGLYIGIFLIMILYNLFIYFSINDKSYFLYVIYIFLFLTFLIVEDGFFYNIISKNSIHTYGFLIRTLPILVGISAIYFIRSFVKSAYYAPKIDRFHIVIIVLYFVSLFLALNKNYNHISYTSLNLMSIISATYAITLGVSVILKGFKPAWFFIIAWSILLISVFHFALSHLGIISYLPITDHILKIGTVIEIVLLSLGLANRINVLKFQKEASQAKNLELISEKKSFIENQNIELENMVAVRTKKLEDINIIISKKNKEKSIMMREIHHRVKNNLQMISSMVRIQSRYTESNNNIYPLKEVERRIQTMALLHEKIYQSDNLVEINIKEYIESILLDLLTIYKVDNTSTYNLDINDFKYETETVLFLGLLINELLTNALKHVLKEEKNGHISITLKPYNDETHLLIVSNSGKKINLEEFDNSKSIGKHLIKNFVKQLDGVLKIENIKETSFKILFKNIN
jgi:two-component sensor histidine kinase